MAAMAAIFELTLFIHCAVVDGKMARCFYLTALGLLSGVVLVSAQPGPITTSNNSNLVFAASTLLTNGLVGLPGPPVTLMVAAVQPNSAQGGTVSLVTSQPWVRRYN